MKRGFWGEVVCNVNERCFRDCNVDEICIRVRKLGKEGMMKSQINTGEI